MYVRKLISVFKLSSQPDFGFPISSDTKRAVWPKEMARGLDLLSRWSLLSMYAVQPCGYATLFLHMQKAGITHDAAYIVEAQNYH